MPNTSSPLQIICLESEAFYALIETVVTRMQKKQPQMKKWLDEVEAMQELNIRSKTTLQKLRDERAIRFTQPKKKIILYDRDSILEYLEKHAKEPIK